MAVYICTYKLCYLEQIRLTCMQIYHVMCEEDESDLVFWIVKLDLLDSLCCEMSSSLVVQYMKELVAWVGR